MLMVPTQYETSKAPERRMFQWRYPFINPLQQSWREASQQRRLQVPGSAEGGEAAAKPAASCRAECYPAGRLFLKFELVIQISILGLYLCWRISLAWKRSLGFLCITKNCLLVEQGYVCLRRRLVSWKGEVKRGRCVGKKEQVVPTPLPTNLCNTYYFSLGSKRNDYPAHPLFFRQDGGAGFNLTTGLLHWGGYRSAQGKLRHVKAVSQAAENLLGSARSWCIPRGAARCSAGSCSWPGCSTDRRGSWWSPHASAVLPGSRPTWISDYWNCCRIGTRYY